MVSLLLSCRNRVADNMRLLNQVKEEYSDVQIPLPVLE